MVNANKAVHVNGEYVHRFTWWMPIEQWIVNKIVNASRALNCECMQNSKYTFSNPRPMLWPTSRLQCSVVLDLHLCHHIKWCDHFVYPQEKLPLAKIDLKIWKSLMFSVFQAIVYLNDVKSLSSFYFKSCNIPELHCFEKAHTKQCYSISKISFLHWMAKTWWGTSSEQWMYT